ncbi:molybdenum cofactor guanylyltransferase [Paenibacillus piri]|uniref:Molybdenum cofactor guanylyltransferase n=1 Tax=Paenibacillus piri TaxID=2547395 RepID=A0A4R5KLX8_9BACL|nr:NTP transferase domain-containing protein [Paenibacillus piri]TDF96591.1 molybdenum cofactor guanylyltransferase [Paenibacillus piri]
MLTGVILAGGEHDVGSALRLINGEPRISRQIGEMQAVCEEIIIVANEPRKLLPVVPRSVRIITDFIPGFGALSGMHAAFTLAKHYEIWVITCRERSISSAAAQLLCERRRSFDYEAALPMYQEHPLPFHGVYSRSCLAPITGLLEMKERGIDELLKRISWGAVDEAFFHDRQVDTGNFDRMERKLNKSRDRSPHVSYSGEQNGADNFGK